MQTHKMSFTGSYVGIDASLNSTGFAHLAPDGLTTWSLNPGERKGPERLGWLRDATNDLLRRVVPTCVVVEGYSFGSPNKAHQIGEWGGVLRLLLWESGVPFYEATPSSLKKFVTGKGSGGKGPLMMCLYKYWGFEVPQEDEADATGLALMAAYMGSPGLAPWLAHRKEALKKVNAVRRLLEPARMRRRAATAGK